MYACDLESPFQVWGGGGDDIPCHSGLIGWFLTGGRAPAARYQVVGAHERQCSLCCCWLNFCFVADFGKLM